jgi:hypothetical protein
MYELDPNILAHMLAGKRDNERPSHTVRQIFRTFGEISPPVMAHYFENAYGGSAMEYMPALGSWWHDGSSDISDETFDIMISRAITGKA